MAATLTLEGTFAFRFVGFDRTDTHACTVAGVGTVTLKLDPNKQSGTLTGTQFVTNSPMSGQQTNLDNTTYSLSGDFTIDDSGPPILATSNIVFTQGEGPGRKLSDQFAIVQTGPDRLSVISKKPHDELRHKDVQELVSGELIKVDPATW